MYTRRVRPVEAMGVWSLFKRPYYGIRQMFAIATVADVSLSPTVRLLLAFSRRLLVCLSKWEDIVHLIRYNVLRELGFALYARASG